MGWEINNVFAFLRNSDNSAVTAQNVEEVDVTDVYDNDATNKLKKSALLSVCALGDLVDLEKDIKVQLTGNSAPVVIKAWQAMQGCYKVTKIYQTGTTVDIQYIKLNR